MWEEEEEKAVVVVSGPECVGGAGGWEGWVSGRLVVVVRMWSSCRCGRGYARRPSGFAT